jgi:hypothetical protein
MECAQAWRGKTPRVAQGPSRDAQQTLEIRAVEVTSSDVGDAPMLPELLSQIRPDQEITSVTAERGAAAVIPPRRNAKP